MARFIGTEDEFNQYIGPRTNKIVTSLGKELRKKQKSCQNHVEGIEGDKCGKHKLLDAAHFSHKNRDRKSIIKEILDKNFSSEDNYDVDLEYFNNLFIEAHYPLEENLVMLCRQHHSQYDKKNKRIVNYAEDAVEIEEVIDIHVALDFKKNAKEIKKDIISQIEYLSSGDVSIASLSHDSWNFNISKNSSKGWLLAFNQYDNSVTILKYDLTAVDVSTLVKKDKKKLSLNIPFSDEKFIEKKTGYVFEVVDSYQVEQE